MEGISVYLWYNSIQNRDIYNWFTAFEFGFYLYLLREIVKSKKVKKVILITSLIFLPLTSINIAFIQGKDGFHSVTYSVGCLLIVAFSIYYFYELFKLPKSVALIRESEFWICSGILFFYCCSFPLMGLVNFLDTVPRLIIDNLDFFLTLLNVMLYSLYTIAFLCRIKIRRYTMSS